MPRSAPRKPPTATMMTLATAKMTAAASISASARKTETADTDGDGLGDNADAFPLDPTKTAAPGGNGGADGGAP